MADTKISALTDGTTAEASDRLAVARDPTGTPLSRYVTPAYIKDYVLGLANTWTAKQTITPPANTEALVVSGYSLTGSNAQALVDLAGTWNTTGTPTAIKLNVTDTASNASSLLLDLQVGGASKLAVAKTGLIKFPSATTPATLIQFASTGYGIGSNANGETVINIAGAARCVLGTALKTSGQIGFGSVSSASITLDAILEKDAANTIAQRNGTNAQTNRLYYSYTDASNYTRLALKTATGVHTIETESAGTGEANIDLALTPKGTGAVRFGTHSAIAAETVTGYITIKDAGGTSRKVAVVS